MSTVPKPGRDVWSILNLKKFSKFLKVQKYQRKSAQSVIALLPNGCFLVLVDIKDAYLHITIFSLANNFWSLLPYSFVALPFGLLMAPRGFTKGVGFSFGMVENLGYPHCG